MHRLPLLIQLIFQQPKLSDRRIGLCVGRTPQTVRRYITLIQRRRLTWSQLRHLDHRALDQTLNRRRGPPQKRKFDVSAVSTALARPGIRLRAIWRQYALIDPETAVCYPHFLRRYRAACPWHPNSLCVRQSTANSTAVGLDDDDE